MEGGAGGATVRGAEEGGVKRRTIARQRAAEGTSVGMAEEGGAKDWRGERWSGEAGGRGLASPAAGAHTPRSRPLAPPGGRK